MNCTVCTTEISDARLRAVPSATKCIVCASANDVPMTRRFDETVGEDTVQEYYTGPTTLDISMRQERLNHVAFGLWSTDNAPAGYRKSNKVRTARPDENVAVTTQADVSELADKI